MLIKTLLSLCIVVCTMFVCSCSWLQTACNTAMPDIAKANALGDEAQAQISQAEAYGARLPFDQATREQFDRAIAAARNVVSAGQATVATFADACSSPDATVIFGDLVTVWAKIETLLASPLRSASASGFPPAPVRPPAVVILMRKNLILQ